MHRICPWEQGCHAATARPARSWEGCLGARPAAAACGLPPSAQLTPIRPASPHPAPQVEQRDDSRFFLALGAAVLLPAALGLGLAAGTGYLDHLQSALY